MELGFLERTYLDAWAVAFGSADGVKKFISFDPPDFLFSFQTSAEWKTPIISSVYQTVRIDGFRQNAKHVLGLSSSTYQQKQENILRPKTTFCENLGLALEWLSTSSESTIVLIWTGFT